MEKRKKISGKIKLNQLSVNELEKRAMSNLKGGSACDCSSSTSTGAYWCKARPVG